MKKLIRRKREDGGGTVDLEFDPTIIRKRNGYRALVLKSSGHVHVSTHQYMDPATCRYVEQWT